MGKGRQPHAASYQMGIRLALFSNLITFGTAAWLPAVTHGIRSSQQYERDTDSATHWCSSVQISTHHARQVRNGIFAHSVRAAAAGFGFSGRWQLGYL
jgi:hypothetical protein